MSDNPSPEARDLAARFDSAPQADPRAFIEGREVTVGDLTLAHVGRMVTIEGHGATITGQLREFSVDQDWITVASMQDDPDDAEQIPGRRTARVTIGQWTTTDLPLKARVVLP